MSIQLPPKRFDRPDNAKYDSIRHKFWFHKLEARRKKIPLLEGAYNDFMHVRRTQEESSEAWGIDARELRDYCKFVNNSGKEINPTHRQILNDAYVIYCTNKGDTPFPACIERVSWYYGIDPRHVVELWEVDPTFFPKGYN